MNINPFLLPNGVTIALQFLKDKLDKLKSIPLVIAIDGHASSGKSTLATDLGEILKLKYLDSGAMYRAVTLYFLEQNIDFNDNHAIECALKNISIDLEYESNKKSTYLNGVNVERQIRGMDVSNNVSKIARISSVRKFLVHQLRILGKSKGVIMDGRDIGSVVFPNAEIKFYVTASMDERANRRFAELQSKNIEASPETVRQNLEERDKIDSSREDSPLIMAQDAMILDTTFLNRSEQLQSALKLIFNKLGI